MEYGRRGGRSPRGIRSALAIVLAAALAGPGTIAVGAADDLGAPRPFTLRVSSDRGSGRIDSGQSCAEGGDGGYWHYDYDAPLPAGVITGPSNPLTGSLRLHVDVHSEDQIVRTTPGEQTPGQAWLQGTESAITLANQRGTVRMDLRSTEDAAGAGCATARSLAIADGKKVTGAGLRWKVAAATGSYRDAAGAGTAAVGADVAPGADNPFTLDVAGEMAVLQPNLGVEVIDTYWAYLGAHYLKRWVTVIYRITNTGPGDAFGVRLTGASSPTAGMKLVGPIPSNTSTKSLGPVPQHLGDLASGQSEIVRLRWQLPVPSGNPPCGSVILGCRFDSTLSFDMPDALDVIQASKQATVPVKAPDFPPPVVD